VPRADAALADVFDACCGAAARPPADGAAAAPAPCELVVRGVVGREHAAVRAAAYPYDVSHLGGDDDAERDLVVEARETGRGARLLGFVAFNGSSIVDLAVDPAGQGRGLGARLVTKGAQVLLERRRQAKAAADAAADAGDGGEAERADADDAERPEKDDDEDVVTLDVRWYNLTARKLYLLLGFRETERKYQSWYDWHGGVAMKAPLAALASGAPRARPPLPEPIEMSPAAAARAAVIADEHEQQNPPDGEAPPRPSLFAQKGKPRSREGKPGSREGKPRSREGKPRSRDGKPGSRDGKPGSRDGDKRAARSNARDGGPRSRSNSREGSR